MAQTKQDTVRLYVVEEDEIYLDLCRAVLQLKAPIELLGVLSSRDIRALRSAILKHSPDVVLVNIKKLDIAIIKEFEQIRMDNPKIGIIMLLGFCSTQDIELLRRLALLKGAGGTALFLKQPLDSMGWLCMAISAASQSQFILDAPLAAFMFAGKPGYITCPR